MMLDELTRKNRDKAQRAEYTKRILIIIASLLAFPIALPIYLAIWTVKAVKGRL